MFTPMIGRMPRRGLARQPRRGGRRPVVVEPHAVDDRAVRDQAEQPRLRVAGLRARGDGADLDVAEAELAEAADAAGVLVESGGDAERRREVSPSVCTASRGSGRVARRTSAPRPMAGSIRMTRKARWCAGSGSRRDSTSRKRRRYIPLPGYCLRLGASCLRCAASARASASARRACSTRSSVIAASKSSSESKPW